MVQYSRIKNFEYFKSEEDGQYYFNLLNKEDHPACKHDGVLIKSEGYKSKRGKNVGINSVVKNSKLRRRYVIKQAKDGRWYFILKAGNGKTIGSSPMKDSVEIVEKNIKLSMRYGY
ncbi:hypothetical protein LCGC14_2878540 [marine sediment metagenome]|uniref:DUF1508 domain-containing protein n=1 Tax=marine sediment metagenome TaxID=412755 RepID=A0A0F9A8X9_9ZZZZ